MEMESTRRTAFDRSREPGLKKPRLEVEPIAAEEAKLYGRAYSIRTPTGAASVSAMSERYWSSNGRFDSASARAEAYQPQSQPQLYHELVCQYKEALAELTFNSKPIITNLTIIAGENLHAAKAVTVTICSNILEVPSDQKLPSLYLLDSIVKNIGREYIQYFSARLPEVFCKAFRQIDPTMHQSMRHLFGTWKGVFPPQTLQAIEKELGFSASLNNSGTPSSRPDSQAQRLQHSIHVNPKYLERQCLNNRVKGTDGSLSAVISVNERERLERLPGSDIVRPWVDKIHPSQRDVSTKQMNEKKIVSYGDMESTSDLLKNPSPGTISGKLDEPPLRGRSWLNVSGSGKEATSNPINGFSLNQSSIKPSREDSQLPSNPGSTSRNIAKFSNWKNSEEKEFTWDSHPKLSELKSKKSSSVLRKNTWGSDDSEKMDISDLVRTRRFPDTELRFDRESSSDSLLPSQWTQTSQQVEKFIDSDISVPGITFSDELQKFPAEDLLDSSQKSSLPGLSETSRKSTTSSLLSAVMESGILSKLSSDGQKKSDHFSDGTPDASSTPISNLLSSLVSKGLISEISSPKASNKIVSEIHGSSASPNPPQAIQNSVSSTLPSVPSTSESGNEESCSESALKTTPVVSESLIGLYFKPDVLRDLHPQVLSLIFEDIPHQCTICGLRLKVKQQLEDHSQLHKSQNMVRNWYLSSEKWIARTTGLSERDITDDYDEPMVIGDDDQFVCIFCGELFQDYYNQKLNTWMFKGAMRLHLPGNTKNEINFPIIHAKCSSGLLISTIDIKTEKMDT